MNQSKFIFLLVFIVLFNGSCVYGNSKELTVDSISDDLASDYTDLTKALIVETPEELKNRLISMELSITVNNRYGLKSKTDASNSLREECAELLPDVNEDFIADSCIFLIVEKSFEKIVNEADSEMMIKINYQSEIMRNTNLGEGSDNFTRDMHINKAVNIINSAFEAQNSNLKLQVSDEFSFKSNFLNNAERNDKIMPGRSDIRPHTVIDAIHQLVYLSRSCLRQGPGVVWLGKSCDEFSPAENW